MNIRHTDSARYDNLVISVIAAISISFTALLSMSFPFEPGLSGFGSSYEECPALALENGFSQSICLHREFSNTAWGDSFEYFSMAVGEDSHAPYSLRPLIPIILAKVSSLTLSETQITDKDRLFEHISNVMVYLNLLTGILLAVIPILVFKKLYLKASSNVTLVVLTGVINFGVVQTAPFLMVDLASYLVFMCAAYFFFSRKIALLSLTACIGVLVKEISIILFIPLIALLLESNRKNILTLFYILLPFFVFVILRVMMNEDPMSMQYGWKISQGEISLHYLMFNLGGFSNFIVFIIKVVSGLGGILVLAIYFHIKYSERNVFFTTTIMMVVAVIIANILLASEVPRVVGVVMPFLLFYTLYVLNHKALFSISDKSTLRSQNDK